MSGQMGSLESLKAFGVVESVEESRVVESTRLDSTRRRKRTIALNVEESGFSLTRKDGDEYYSEYYPLFHRIGARLDFDACISALNEMDVDICVHWGTSEISRMITDRLARKPRYDTYIAGKLVEYDGRCEYSLEALGSYVFGVPTQTLAYPVKSSLLPAGACVGQGNTKSEMVFRLMEHYHHKIIEMGINRVYITEVAQMYYANRIMLNGVGFDQAAYDEARDKINLRKIELCKMIDEYLPAYLIHNPAAMSTHLFGRMGLDKDGLELTKSGYVSMKDENLAKLDHPVIDLIREYNGLSGLVDAYFDPIKVLVNNRDGRIHAKWDSLGTVTHRYSCTSPNLMNFPASGFKSIARSFIVPRTGWTFVSFDLSQIDLRVIAAMTGNQFLLDVFRDGLDIHAMIANLLYGTPVQDVTDEQRRIAKQAGFKLIYGCGMKEIAKALNTSEIIAREFERVYWQTIPGLKGDLVKFEQVVGSMVCRSYYGTPMMLDSSTNDLASLARQARNYPVQCTASEIMKQLELDFDRRIKKYYPSKSEFIRPVMVVHDELVLEVAHEQLVQVAMKVFDRVISEFDFPVKLEYKVKTGSRWNEMKLAE
jgi:DNA polymerase-1